MPEDARQQYINDKIDEQFSAFNEVSVKSSGHLGVLEWLDDQIESVVVQLKNKPQFMGRSMGGKIYLNSEETLFLIESSSAICNYKSLQLSLQDAFSLMIKSDLEFERYMVYSYLLKFGFRVKRRSMKSGSSVDRSKDDLMECNSIKRPIDVSDQTVKRTKLDVDESKIANLQINVLPLQQLVSNLHLIDEFNELDFMKFIRFSKLNRTIHGSWSELIDEYNRFKCSSRSKSAFVVENLEHLDATKCDSSEMNEFSNDFLSDSPLIRFNESLTDDEIQHRLAPFGPQLDLSDELSSDRCLSEETNQDHLDTYDYDVYLPSKKHRTRDTQPDYYLKILHYSQNRHFPIDQVFKLNSITGNREKLLFVICQSNEFNFYQFTDVDLINCQ